MSREVIATDGRHYRLHPTKPHIVQVQDEPGANYRTHVTCKATPDATAEEVAAAWLAMLGRLSTNAEVSE